MGIGHVSFKSLSGGRATNVFSEPFEGHLLLPLGQNSSVHQQISGDGKNIGYPSPLSHPQERATSNMERCDQRRAVPKRFWLPASVYIFHSTTYF
ncbi:hypothetical protein N9571_03455 [Yoonia sp.]|nr:hypothetical protein [Yoonia sp.]